MRGLALVLSTAAWTPPAWSARVTRSFFRHGASRDRRESLAEFTGGPLAPDVYLEDLLGSVGP